jgi:hypothetical protein
VTRVISNLRKGEYSSSTLQLFSVRSSLMRRARKRAIDLAWVALRLGTRNVLAESLASRICPRDIPRAEMVGRAARRVLHSTRAVLDYARR